MTKDPLEWQDDVLDYIYNSILSNQIDSGELLYFMECLFLDIINKVSKPEYKLEAFDSSVMRMKERLVEYLNENARAEVK